jgi:hypothetical protein
MAGIDQRIEESKNWFERLAQRIPGYKGYKEKELGREADKIERSYVAERLDSSRKKLEDLQLDLTGRGNLDMLGTVDITLRRLRKVRDRVQFADYGYAGLFDTTKVGKEKIDELYAFDKQLEAEAGNIEQFTGALSPDSPSLRTDIGLLDERIGALDAQFDQREHLITGAGR